MPRRSRTGRKTDYSWQGQSVNVGSIDLATGTVTDGANAIVSFGAPFTIMRVRGELLFQLDAGAVNERILIAVGLIVISANQVSVGVTSMPHPFTDIEDTWLWHQYVTLSSLAEAAIQPDALFSRVMVDSKAMRKVKPTESLALVAEVVAGSDQGGTFDMLGGFRVLVGD